MLSRPKWRIIRHTRIILIAITLSLGTIGLFQNCGQSFSVGPSASFSASSSGEPSDAMVLMLNPFQASGNNSLPFGTDVSQFLTPVRIGKVAPGPFLQDERSLILLDRDGAHPSSLVPSAASYMFSATDPRFAHVNSFYHINRLRADLQAASLFPSDFKAIHVDPHCVDGENSNNNAYFDWTERLLCMGSSKVGTATAWSSMDADVLVHEFGHALNHGISSTEILSSTLDLGALDEGLSDVWAFLQNGNPYVAKWYGAAIYSGFLGGDLSDFKGLRNLEVAPSYPDSLIAQVHADSTPISTLFYELQKNGVAKSQLMKLAARLLSNLQVGDNAGSAFRYIREEAAELGISSVLVSQAMQRRGVLRKDNLSALSLATNAVSVVDSHKFESFQKEGNCNGALDKGETVLVYVDITNGGAVLGGVKARLSTTAPDTEIKIVPGGDFGTFIRFKANQSYKQSELSARLSDTYFQLAVSAGFAIEATAMATGSYNFSIALEGFNSIDDTPVTRTLNFSIPVGAVATQTAPCAQAAEDAVWP